MTLYKKATISSSIIVASAVYDCSNCDYTEMVTDVNDKEKECPKCHSVMKLISSSCSGLDDNQIAD